MPFQFDRSTFVTATTFKGKLSQDPNEAWECALAVLADSVLGHLPLCTNSCDSLLILETSPDDCPEAGSFWEWLDEKAAATHEEAFHNGALRLRVYHRDGVTVAVTDDQNAETRVMVAEAEFDSLNTFVATLDLQ